jgi:hypothetical protein
LIEVMLASRALTVTATGQRKWARAISGAPDAQRLFKEDMNMLYDSKSLHSTTH